MEFGFLGYAYRDKFGINALFIRERTPQGPDQAEALVSIRLSEEVIHHYRGTAAELAQE